MRRSRKPGWGTVYAGRWPELSWGERRMWWLDGYRDAHDGLWPVCVVCGTSWELSNGRLHHRLYAKPGRERWGDLVPMCADDHETFKKVLQHNLAFRRLSREQATDRVIAFLRSKLTEPVSR